VLHRIILSCGVNSSQVKENQVTDMVLQKNVKNTIDSKRMYPNSSEHGHNK
jgi:hypothetical protein